MAKVIERLEAHYEVPDAELGKVYRRCPESVVVECECGKHPPLTVRKSAGDECGAACRVIVRKLFEARPEDE